MKRAPDRPRRAAACICGKHLFERENEGTCVWCGHGLPRAVVELAYRRNMVAMTPELDRRLFAESAGNRPRRLQVVGPPHSPRPARRVWTMEACVEAARDWERVYGHLPKSRDWLYADDTRVNRPTYDTVRKLCGGWSTFRREIADVPRERIAA